MRIYNSSMEFGWYGVGAGLFSHHKPMNTTHQPSWFWFLLQLHEIRFSVHVPKYCSVTHSSVYLLPRMSSNLINLRKTTLWDCYTRTPPSFIFALHLKSRSRFCCTGVCFHWIRGSGRRGKCDMWKQLFSVLSCSKSWGNYDQEIQKNW